MHKTLVTAALIVLSLSACSGSAHLVRKDATGGHIALQGPYMPAMGDARMLMAENCQGRYEAVEHGNSVEFNCVRAKPEAARLQIAKASEPSNGTSIANGM